MIRELIILVLLTTLFSCNDQEKQREDETVFVNPMERLNKNKAGETVRNAIAFVGGWDKWNKKNSFSFYKIITQVDSSGEIKKTQKQLHQYNLKPEFQARMSWKDNEDDYMIINNGDEARKYKNGEFLTDDKSKNEAWNSSFGSNYVISMPFKLTDPGTILTYDGIDSTTLDKPVHALKVEYEKGAGSSGGFHTWWYYFDLNTYDLVANFLDYGDKYSLTTYETFTEVEGIRIHLKRFSYSSNEKKEKVLLRTIYENEGMGFNQIKDATIFELL